MINLLAGPIAGMIKDAVTGFVETKKAKSELKLTEIKAQKSLKEQQIAGKISWEASAVDQMKGSWKDEFVLIVLTLPILVIAYGVFSDDPTASAKIKEFFEQFQQLPSWFTNLWILVVASIYGIKGTQIFKGKK